MERTDPHHARYIFKVELELFNAELVETYLTVHIQFYVHV